MSNKLVFLDRDGNLVEYDVNEFVRKPLPDIARDLGFEDSVEYIFAQIPLIIAWLELRLCNALYQKVVEFFDFEAKSNYWGE